MPPRPTPAATEAAQLLFLWRSVRGPFRYPAGAGHTCDWERFDGDKAGCLRCGLSHQCGNNSVDCASCPVEHLPDGSRCCGITGLVVSEVNTSHVEYCPSLPPPGHAASATATRYDYNDILEVVEWLLTSKQYATSRERELERLVVKCKASMVRTLRRLKQERPNELPNLVHVISTMLAEERCTRAFSSVHAARMPALCRRVAAAVTAVFQELHKHTQVKTCFAKFRNLVVGVLYMMSTGLVVQGREILPCWPDLRVVLPQENHLAKYWGISSKIICETENEVKLILRGQFAQQRKKSRDRRP